MDKPLSEDESKTNVGMSELLMEGDLTDRKITRNQKRKHDEINHVQKVFAVLIISLEKYNSVCSFAVFLLDL